MPSSPEPHAPPTPSHAAGLPPHLVEDAAGRVAWLALGVAAAIPAVQLLHWLVQPTVSARAFDEINRLAALLVVLGSLGLFAVHRYRAVTPSAMLPLGSVLQMAVAFVIALVETAVPLVPGQAVLGVSLVGPWIVAVSALVPNEPRWTLGAALASATMWPLAYLINAARLDLGPEPVGPRLLWPLFNYVMAALAYAVAGRLYRAHCVVDDATDIGSYQLLSRIGEGGMGEVWRARHRLLARPAAVKLIRPEAVRTVGRDADVAAARFRREATLIATLQSPHTVYVYDFGVSRDDRFYYAMELLDGVSLHALVSSFGPAEPSRAVFILAQVCQSLEEAHERGIVHRDLKPSNVMLCKVALEHDFVKVLDFGLAKRTGNVGLTQQLTIVGTATGTPGYIAPEVALGEGTVDRRADVYAMGCVAYFLLTGTPVFDEENPTKLALLHVQEAPEPVSVRSVQRIPLDLEAVVMRCLAKRPTERPSSVAEVARLLARLDMPVWTGDDARTWWEANLPASSPLRGAT